MDNRAESDHGVKDVQSGLLYHLWQWAPFTTPEEGCPARQHRSRSSGCFSKDTLQIVVQRTSRILPPNLCSRSQRQPSRENRLLGSRAGEAGSRAKKLVVNEISARSCRPPTPPVGITTRKRQYSADESTGVFPQRTTCFGRGNDKAGDARSARHTVSRSNSRHVALAEAARVFRSLDDVRRLVRSVKACLVKENPNAHRFR